MKFVLQYSIVLIWMAISLQVNARTGLESIYGIDNRVFIHSKMDAILLKQSKAIALIVDNENLTKRFFRSTLLGKTLQENVQLCSDEKFSTKPSIKSCTGFLVKSNILLTAGHCIVDENDCENKKIIFDVLDSPSKLSNSNRTVLTNNVYGCKSIIARGQDGNSDFSLIQLDKTITDRTPLEYNKSSLMSRPASVYMIGHPYGLSQMLSRSTKVRAEDSGDLIFKASINSFQGNSGSPVFNSETHKVEGVLINGQEDLVFDSQNKCYRYRVYNGAGGEGILSISHILPFIN